MTAYLKRKELLNSLNELERKKRKIKSDMDEIDKSFGVPHMSMVYGETINPAKFTVSIKEAPTFTVHEFIYREKEYRLIFDFLNRYDIGGSFSLEQFENKLKPEEYKILIDAVCTFEDVLLENSIKMFEKLDDTRKVVHRELDRLMPSRKKKYTYLFRGRDNKKFTMGFMIISNF